MSFERTERLVGTETMDRIANARVILFGVGGVGSWCAEGLVRSGIRHLTLVDADRVAPSNINRQLMATTRTVGRSKVQSMRERLLEINPEAEITALETVYTDESAGSFHLDGYDFIIDAIDSLKDKASLILRATATRATVFSSMGAACKLDPTRVAVAEFWDVRGCPLGSALRKKYRKQNTLPARKFLCVYDEEVLPNLGPDAPKEPGNELFFKACTNGTAAPVTGIFGLTLAGLVLQSIHQSLHP